MSLSLRGFLPSRGHLRPEINMAIPMLIERHGTKAAMEITEFEISHLAKIKDLVEKENIDCDLVFTTMTDVLLDSDRAEV